MTTETLPLAAPPIRQVATDAPWRWLAAGWQDLLALPSLSLAYGGAVCLAGWLLSLLLFETGTLWAILPASAGFFLVGPLLAAGLYEASRLREAGRRPGRADILAPFRRNGSQLGLLGLVLLLIHLFWVRVAGLLFMLFFGQHGVPAMQALPLGLLRSEQLLPFLVIGTGFGCILAAASFAAAAVSVPMLVDREISALEAVALSLRAVLANWRAMLLWAALIVVFTGLALVPFYLGLVLVFPLIGHASWHAYCDVASRPGITA